MKRLGLILMALVCAAAQAAPIDDMVTDAYRDNPSGITELLLAGVNPNVLGEKGRSPLDMALHEGNDRATQALLADPRVDINFANAFGETPLMQAAIKGRLDLVEAFVKRGAQINRPGWTPLHYAASGSEMKVAKWLLEQGADINARSPDERTPLMMAASVGPYDLADLLIAHGADVTLRDKGGRTAADYAAGAGRDRLQAHLTALLSEKH